MQNNSRKPVLIYRRELLPFSETFIREQSEALEGFIPTYVGVHRVTHISLPPERTLILSDGSWFGRLRMANFRITQYDPLWLHQMRRVKPHLIHAHFEWGGKDALPLARALKIPLLTTCHGKDVTESDDAFATSAFSKRLHAARRENLQREGAWFLGVSEFIKRKMLERGYPEDRVSVHYIGVDTTLFAPPERTGTQEPLIVFVGRLIEKKGCEYLIRAFAELPSAEFPGATLAIIGDGPLRGNLEALARELGVADRVKFVGVQSPAQIREWLTRASVFSLPSVTAESGETEGLPIVILEALSMGVPVVSFDHAGIGEAVIDGKTGFLSKERDWRGLAANIARLFKDPALWLQISRAGRQHIEEKFDLKQQTKALEKIYEKLTSAS